MDTPCLRIEPHTKLHSNQELFSSKIDDETVMMDENQGLYFGLNPVASSIWTLLEKPLTFQELVTHLLDMYDVTENQCRQEVEKFLYQLLEKNLIKILD
jgi:hypothetical protein